MISNNDINSALIYLPSGVLTGESGGFYAHLSWAEEVNRKSDNSVIMSISGRPTAPLFTPIIDANRLYWSNQQAQLKAAIDYGDIGRGQLKYRDIIAAAFSRDYNTEINAKDVVFTVGGKSAINSWHYLIKTLRPGKKLVLAVPYYPDHLGVNELGLSYSSDQLILVDTLNEKLTAEKILSTLNQRGINDDADEIGAFIFCDPSNPMGYVIGESEWRRIICSVLLKHKQAFILLDEAYSEMVFANKHVSLLSLADTDELKERILVLRSATKGLSAAGERYACLLSFSSHLTEIISHYNDTNLIHAPLSSQHAYAYAMERFTLEDRRRLAKFYSRLVCKTEKLLQETRFDFKERRYSVDSAFYVVADFSKLIYRVLDERVNENVYLNGGKRLIEDDVDIAFHLLFKYKLAFCPMSMFGVEKKRGLMRITCSFTASEFVELRKRLKQVQIEESDANEDGENMGKMVLSLKQVVKSLLYETDVNTNKSKSILLEQYSI